jgi:hypothetical protein
MHSNVCFRNKQRYLFEAILEEGAKETSSDAGGF